MQWVVFCPPDCLAIEEPVSSEQCGGKSSLPLSLPFFLIYIPISPCSYFSQHTEKVGQSKSFFPFFYFFIFYLEKSFINISFLPKLVGVKFCKQVLPSCCLQMLLCYAVQRFSARPILIDWKFHFSFTIFILTLNSDFAGSAWLGN